MEKIRVFLTGIGFMFSVLAISQDLHFSQFNASPLNLNPALTGLINGKARVIANYRNQLFQILGGDSYKTYAISYDQRVNLKSGNYVGLGIAGIKDLAGELDFGRTQANFSFSFAKILMRTDSTSHYLIGGIQFGIAKRKVDLSGARWPSGFDNTVSSSIPTPEGFRPDFLHPDLNFGIAWESRFGARKSLLLGITVYHINKPNISFFSKVTKEPLSIRTALHARGELPLSIRLSLVPSFIYLNQGVHSQLSIGTNLSVTFASHPFLENIRGGLFYRIANKIEGGLNSDTVIMVLSFQFNEINFGFSFDRTISKLKEVRNTNSAFELSVGYLFGGISKEVIPIDKQN